MKEQESTSKDQEVPFITSFWRSQASSLMSSSTDFIVYGILFFGLGLYPVYSSFIGNVFGAVVSFILGRKWAFKSEEGKITTQALKYAITSVSSAFINTYLLYLCVESIKVDPTISKVVVSIVVGIVFNFPMFRYFVFKK